MSTGTALLVLVAVLTADPVHPQMWYGQPQQQQQLQYGYMQPIPWPVQNSAGAVGPMQFQPITPGIGTYQTQQRIVPNYDYQFVEPVEVTTMTSLDAQPESTTDNPTQTSETVDSTTKAPPAKVLRFYPQDLAKPAKGGYFRKMYHVKCDGYWYCERHIECDSYFCLEGVPKCFGNVCACDDTYKAIEQQVCLTHSHGTHRDEKAESLEVTNSNNDIDDLDS